MNNLQLGKMYLVKEFFWFLYPAKELVRWPGRSSAAVAGVREVAYHDAKWFSQEFKCNVSVVEENTYVVLLEEDGKLKKILTSDGNIGWISCSDFSGYFELVKE